MATSTTQTLATATGFLSSIAVNTHMGFGWKGYDDLSLVKQSLTYIGVNTVRDGLTNLPQAQPVLSALAAAGYKFDLVTSSGLPETGSNGLANYIKALNAFEAANPGSIIAVEGLNEANAYKFSYNGSSSITAAAKFQAELYTAVKGSAALKDIPVYNMTLAYDNPAEFAELGDLGKYSDYANAHAYVSTNTTVGSALDKSLSLAASNSTKDPLVITETGYTTAEKTAHVGANETAQAKSILNTLVTAFKDGVAKTYLYELLDRGDDPLKTNSESNFGLFEVDGTPKMAATALHNLTTILNDDGTGTALPTKALGYTISNLQATGDSMVLAKSNGAYDLVVWNAPKVWNDAADKEIVNPSQSVKIHFDSVQKTVVVYDPMGGHTPIATYSNVQDIVLPISDYPLIVEVGGTGLIPKAQVVTPAHVVGTADSIVAQIDSLVASKTLEKITLTDTNILDVASVATMQSMIKNDQAALSKIVGVYQFAVTQVAPTWEKTEVFDSSGKLVSTREAGIKNGLIFTDQTRYSDGTLDAVNFSNGVKVNEIITRLDGTKDVYNFNIKGKDYAAEHYSYAKGGAMTLYERFHSDGTLALAEIRDGGRQTVKWYDAKGVIEKQADNLANGGSITTIYADGVKSRVYVTNADKTLENYTYGIKGQSYVTQYQKVDKAGTVTEVVRSHADGTTDYQWVKKADGTTVTSNFDAAGHKLLMVTRATNGTVTTDKYDVAGRLTQETIQKNGGYSSITNYTGTVKASVYVTNTDGSKESYLYDAKGDLATKAFITTAGQTTTSVYANGALSRVYVSNPDGTNQNTSYGIKGQSYVTELQKVDKTGTVTEVVRSHADGTPDYQWVKKADGTTVTSNFDAAGHKLLMVTRATNGTVTTDKYDVAGRLTQESIQKNGGYVSITNYTGTVKASVYVTNTDGSKESYLYDAKGDLATKAFTTAAGQTTTSVYANGALSRVYVDNPDGTNQNTSYGIKGQSYVTELQKVDKTGTVTEVVRSHADGTPDYQWVKKADGTTVTSNFDAAGHKLLMVTRATNGTVTTDKYDVAGRLTQETIQKNGGYSSITNYTGTVKASVYVTNTDGSKESYLYDAKGDLATKAFTTAAGLTTTSVYANGALSRVFVENADGTAQNTSYGIKGQSYVTEVQKVDKAGAVTEVVRSHADGTPDYKWVKKADGTTVTSNYDAAGHKLSAVTKTADGAIFSELFNPSTNAYTKTVAQAANGDVVTSVYTGAVKTAVYEVKADGSKETDLYDTAGKLTSTVRQGVDGHTETSVFAGGVLSKLYVKNADGSGENTSYGIKNQTYVTETQKVDAAGKVVDVQRLHSDGSLDYHMSVASNGTKTTTTYDGAGTKVADVIQYANGSSDVFKFVMAGQPGVSQQETYNASNTLIMLDVTKADGTHQISAKAAGLTLTGGNGNDTVTMYGKDTFVFDHGKDTILNFHADDAAANHDQLQISKSLAASFAALQLSQVGSDTLVTINAHDSILLKGVGIEHVNAGDFVFV